MLSQSTLSLLNKLFEAQNSYKPRDSLAKQLATKNVLTFVSPTCTGKNTIMEAASKIDDRFKVIGTFTSREPRSSDVSYTYYENSDDGLQPLLTSIKEHKVVQYAVNPHANTIYGSDIDDYSGEYNLGDVFSSAIDQFRQLGFRKVTTISLTTDPSIWLKRFEKRFPPGDPQRRARRDEAIESIEWSLAQKSNDHFWVENIDGHPEIASQKVISIATGVSSSGIDARATAQSCLEAAKNISV